MTAAASVAEGVSPPGVCMAGSGVGGRGPASRTARCATSHSACACSSVPLNTSKACCSGLAIRSPVSCCCWPVRPRRASGEEAISSVLASAGPSPGYPKMARCLRQSRRQPAILGRFCGRPQDAGTSSETSLQPLAEDRCMLASFFSAKETPSPHSWMHWHIRPNHCLVATAKATKVSPRETATAKSL